MSEARILAVDTATSHAVLAIGTMSGERIVARSWRVGHAHSVELLPALESLLQETRIRRDDLTGFVVGIGPGSFTGLRVGLATAKVLAYSLARPIVDIETPLAIALAADRIEAASLPAGERIRPVESDVDPVREVTVVMPAGPSGAYVTGVNVQRTSTEVVDAPRIVARDSLEEVAAQRGVVAVDMDVPFGAESRGRGERALARLGEALLEVGARRLREGPAADVATLVPAYVTLPRGIREVAGEIAWSPALP